MVKTSRKCPVCGKDVGESARFCVGCGTDLTQKVGFVSTPDRSYRPRPLTSVGSSRRCPNCGYDIGPTVRFCVECGTDLMPPTSSPPGGLLSGPVMPPGPLISGPVSPSQSANRSSAPFDSTQRTDPPVAARSMSPIQVLLILSIVLGVVVVALVMSVVLSTRSIPGPTPSPWNPSPGPTPGPISPVPTPSTPEMSIVAAGSNRLGFGLLSRANGGSPGGNVFLCPLSIDNAVMLAYNGAAGDTMRQMGQVLGIDSLSVQQANDGALRLLQSIGAADPKVEIDSANSIWLQTGLSVSPQYESLSSRYLGATVGAVDFNDPERAASTINGWTSQRTRGAIPSVLTGLDVQGADLVIANAVYFHGLWSTPFDPSETKLGTFASDGSEAQLPMMHKTDEFAYAEDAATQSVAIPYGNGRLALEIILPRAGHSVDDVVATGGLEAWTARQRDANVDLTMPKFSVDYTDASMKDELAALGMTSAFDPTLADFTAMGLPPGHFLTKVVQKTTLDVDEAGTTATAATDIAAAGAASPMSTPVSMVVDHPFFCAIYDTTTKAVLFEGLVRRPSIIPHPGFAAPLP